MNEINVDQLLLQMRAMAEKAQGLNVSVPATGEVSEFSTLLKSSIDKVNDVQMQAGDMAKRFDAGDETIALSDVMINLQRASVSFQAMTQVRNRLVSVYQDIMNMSI
ncbi:MAG: flagellar hook-basal body complex protein FliE [Gammaproteobacteria bacterium]|nr:flagellar hook-basal body complex protein FliE [Gammaproteobacteria bacterium]